MFGVWVKALIAALAPIGGALGTIAVDPDVIAAVGTGPLVGVTGAAAVIFGVIGFLTRNKGTADQVDTMLQKGDVTFEEVAAILKKYGVDFDDLKSISVADLKDRLGIGRHELDPPS